MNLKYKIEELVLSGVTSKKQIANILDVPYHTVVNTCKKYKGLVPAYGGTKAIHKIGDLKSFSDACKRHTMEEIKRLFKIGNTNTIRGICNELGIEEPIQKQDIWKKNKTQLEELLPQIIDLNHNHRMDIPSIREKLNINSSNSEILKFIKSKDYNVKLHSYNDSRGEKEIREYINNELGIECYSTKITFNNKQYELDCYCPSHNLAIEYCGEYWHSLNKGVPKKYHYNKFKWAEDQGIKLITIWEHEWKENTDLLKNMIKSRLNKNEKLYARKCKVKFIESWQARDFHEFNHINGYVNSSINAGLFFQDKLVGAMSLSKSRFQKDIDYEVTRMSFERGVNVVGGAGKMFAFFRQHHKGTVLTYADLRFGSGDVYEKIGMKYTKTTPPNYFYFERKTGIKYNRMKFQKKKVLKLFPEANPKDTEQDIMMNNGYLVIYDCGNNVYIY